MRRAPSYAPPPTSTSVDFAFAFILDVPDDFDWYDYAFDYALQSHDGCFAVSISSDQGDDRLTLDIDSKTLTVRFQENTLEDGRYYHEARMTSLTTGDSISLFEGWPILTPGVMGARAAPSPTAPAVARAPTLAGSALEGATLTVTPGLYSGFPRPTLTRQFNRNGSPISGATGLTYVIQNADDGANITVTETATNSEGAVSSTSNAIGPVVVLDTTPAGFGFTDVTNQPRSTLTESAAITVSGINAPAPISVTGGEYQVNGGSWTSSSGTVTNGNTVKVRHTTSGSYATAVNTVLTIGGVSDTFTTTTIPDPAVDVMVIIGQSNAGGWPVDPANRSYTTDPLVKSWKNTEWVTYIPATRWDIWESGTYTGYSEEAPYGNWAAELRYAQLHRAANPGRELRIIKYSYGGSTMYSQGGWPDWNPGSSGDLFTKFDTFMTNALAAITAEGKTANIRLVFLMQGEHDAYGGTTTAADYDTNLQTFVTAARSQWPISASTPIVLGRLAPALIENFRTVRDNQVQVALGDANVFWISTDDCPWQEPHYDAAGYIAMGEALWNWDNTRPAEVAASVTPVKLNQAARGANISIASNGLSATRSGGSASTQAVFATRPLNGLKRMFQVTFTAGDPGAVGIGNISGGFAFDNSTNYPGSHKNMVAHWGGRYHAFNDKLDSGAATFGYADAFILVNDVVSYVIDEPNKLVWTAVNNGIWNADAGADPAAGTGGKSFAGMTGLIAPYIAFLDSSSATINFGATPFSRAIPSGFAALNDA